MEITALKWNSTVARKMFINSAKVEKKALALQHSLHLNNLYKCYVGSLQSSSN